MARKPREAVADSPPQATTIRAISLDLGNAYCNLVADGPVIADWRSVQGRVSDARGLNELPFDHVLKIGETWYVFGEAAYTYAPRTLEDFPATNRYTSKWYKRLFAYALHRAYGLRLADGPFYPAVILSIPASHYSNDLVVDNVRENLVGPYVLGTTHGTATQAEILPDNLRIIPEGAGSFLAAAAGNKALESGLWFILDVGYLTSDIVAFRNGDYAPDLATSDPAAGMSRVAQAVARFIAGITGVELRPADIDPHLHCPSIEVNKEQIDIQDVKQVAISALGERIARFVSQAAAGQNLSGLLLTGGGAELMRDAIQIPGLPPALVAPNPRRANVEGAYKLIGE